MIVSTYQALMWFIHFSWGDSLGEFLGYILLSCLSLFEFLTGKISRLVGKVTRILFKGLCEPLIGMVIGLVGDVTRFLFKDRW